MVEASMIYPLIVFIVVAIIYLVTALYHSLYIQTSINTYLRQKSDEIVQKTTCSLEKPFDIESKDNKYENEFRLERVDLIKEVKIEKEKTFKSGMFLNEQSKREFYSSYYLIDESKMIRMAGLFDEK